MTAEIRGHRRTYIGSMPGKILQSLSKVLVRNQSAFLLDEVIQDGPGFRGDPSGIAGGSRSQQNHTFQGVDFDLST